MGSLLVVLIILGCAAYQYLRGSFVKSFIVIIISICASIVAFGFFELVAGFLIGREILVQWAHLFSFILLFILAFAALQAIAVQLTRKPVDLGFLPERIGRVICGILAGLIISGVLLTAVAMAPIPAKYPYQRFDETSPNPENPSRVLLNADGFAVGWFSIISSGSFSGKRSFALLHPAFLDQLFLNRQVEGIPIITVSDAVEISRQAVWPVPDGLKDLNGNSIPLKNQRGDNLTIVRITIMYHSLKTTSPFTPAQLRLICKQKDDDMGSLAGKGINIYPIGYIKAAGQLQLKNLTDRIELTKDDFATSRKEIDFAFYVPEGFVPVLIEFKQNSINQLPPPIAADQAPPAVPFTAPLAPVTPPAQGEASAGSAVESPAADTTGTAAGKTSESGLTEE
ncbi:MAG: CvpA family protein [Sedimentisphaerales bacterium]|nr:CvpA family protein [Sedimentisphaerales bacterium]